MNKLITYILIGMMLIPSALAKSIFTNAAFDTVLILIVVAVVFFIIKNVLKTKK